MLQLRRIDEAQVVDCLPFVLKYLDRATVYSDGNDTETIGLELMEGGLELWLIYDDVKKELVGAVTTGFLVTPLKWSMEIRTLAVDAPRDEWLPLFEQLETYAAIHGCETIEMTGRKGWQKVLPEVGFEEVHITMSKKVGKA